MNKITTSILETVGYFLMTAGINGLMIPFSGHYDPEMLLISFEVSIVFFAIGYALIKWELRIESKRAEQVKHYDYAVLITLGVLCILGALLNVAGSAGGYGNSAIRSDNIINQFGMSICLLAFGFNRKSMYSNAPSSEKAVDMSKKSSEN